MSHNVTMQYHYSDLHWFLPMSKICFFSLKDKSNGKPTVCFLWKNLSNFLNSKEEIPSLHCFLQWDGGLPSLSHGSVSRIFQDFPATEEVWLLLIIYGGIIKAIQQVLMKYFLKTASFLYTVFQSQVINFFIAIFYGLFYCLSVYAKATQFQHYKD